METIFEEVATDALRIVQVPLLRIEDVLLRLQGIATVIEGSEKVRNFDVGEVQTKDVNARRITIQQ